MRYSYEKNCTKEFFETGRRKCFYPNFAVTSYRIGIGNRFVGLSLLKDGIFDFENTDITQYVDDVQEVLARKKI